MPKTKADIQKSNKRVYSDKPSTSAIKRIKTATTTNANEISASELCTPKTISDLPEEVLQKILEFTVEFTDCRFSKKSIRKGSFNASLVCKLWNRLISESKWMMDNLIPKIECKRYSNIPNATKFQITRDYRELEVDYYSYYYFRRMEPETKMLLLPNPLVIMTMISISSIAQHLRKMKLTYMKITPHYISALSLLENFESLDLYNCYSDEYTIEPIELKKLKNLTIFNDKDKKTDILPWIKPCRIMDSISIHSDLDLGSSNGINFLKQIEGLNKLDWSSSGCRLKVEFNSEFCWEKLELEWSSEEVNRPRLLNILKLVEAINPQASPDNAESIIIIEEDSLYSVRRVNEVVKMFNTCKNIKSLTIYTRPAKDRYLSSEVFNSFPVIDTVEKLILITLKNPEDELCAMMIPAIRKLIEHLPNVKEVKLEQEMLCYSDVIKNLSVLKNLRELDIHYSEDLLSDVFSEPNIVKFESLQKLTFLLNKLGCRFGDKVPQSAYNTYDSTEALWKFCAVNPTLDHLDIKLDDCPFWEITRNSNGDVKERSLIRLYTEWLAAETSVKTCRIIIEKIYMKLATTQEEKEFKIFGRVLSKSERKFFIEIVVI